MKLYLKREGKTGKAGFVDIHLNEFLTENLSSSQFKHSDKNIILRPCSNCKLGCPGKTRTQTRMSNVRMSEFLIWILGIWPKLCIWPNANPSFDVRTQLFEFLTKIHEMLDWNYTWTWLFECPNLCRLEFGMKFGPTGPELWNPNPTPNLTNCPSFIFWDKFCNFGLDKFGWSDRMDFCRR